MSVPQTEQKVLCLNSGGICAFPGCGERLVNSFPDGDPTIVGQIAHIVAEQRQGPRGRSELNEEGRNKADNLILLCSPHHKIIDSKPMVFSVEVLRLMKLNHEASIARATKVEVAIVKAPLVKERLHSTYYRHWPLEVTEQEVKAEGYLKSLSPAEELAVFLSIRGMCLSDSKRYEEAAKSFAVAARLSPGCRSYQTMQEQLSRPVRATGDSSGVARATKR